MRVEYSAQAESDIDALEFWIAGEGSPLTGTRYIDRLGAAIDKLVASPFRHPAFAYLGENVRVFVFRHRVRVLYRVESDRVTVVRVFGAAQLIDLQDLS